LTSALLHAGSLRAVRDAHYEALGRPGRIDGTDFVIHQSEAESRGSNDVVGEIGRDAGRCLRPGDPERARRREPRREVRERCSQFCFAAREEYGQIEVRWFRAVSSQQLDIGRQGSECDGERRRRVYE